MLAAGALREGAGGSEVGHPQRLLEAEAVPFEPGALRHIAKAASGSMRDSLSLLDQAIALYPSFERFLQQTLTERSEYNDSLDRLGALFGIKRTT